MIYDNWKDKRLNFDKMIEMHCIDPRNYVHWIQKVYDEDEEGLLTLDEYRYVKYMFSKGYKVFFDGEVEGDVSDFHFDIKDSAVAEYMRQKGTDTNVEFFRSGFGDECHAACPKDDDDDEKHPHRYNPNKNYPVTNEEFETDEDFNVDDIIPDTIKKEKTKKKVVPKKVVPKKVVPKKAAPKKAVPKKKK